MKSLLFILCLAVLPSCMNQRRAAKKIDKLLAQFPEMRDTVRVTVHDTVIVPGDTVVQRVVLRKGPDTVYVNNDRQSVRIIRIPTGSPCDTAEFRADVLATVRADTVIVTNTVEVPRFAPCPPKGVAPWWRTAALVLLVLLVIGYLIGRYLPRR